MNRNEYEGSQRSGLILTFILLNALVVTGCATLGDIETANEKTQQSLNAYKKESRENQAEMKSQLKALRKEIRNLKRTDKQIDRSYDELIKENQALRASLLGITGTLQGFLNAEKRRYEDGLRWIENANKSMGKGTAKPSAGSPRRQSSASTPRAPATSSVKAAPSSKPPGTPSINPNELTQSSPPTAAAVTGAGAAVGAAAAASSNKSPEKTTTPAATTHSPLPGVAAAGGSAETSPQTSASAADSTPSPPPAAPAAVAPTATEPEEPEVELEDYEIPTIKIKKIVIDPPKVSPESSFTVTVQYVIEADPEGPKIKYLEQIELLRGTLSIQKLKENKEREPGTISYSQTIDVPAEAPPGVYTIKGVVSAGPARHSKIKTFFIK